MFLFNFSNFVKLPGGVSGCVLGSTVAKQMSDGQGKIITESSGAVIKIFVRLDEVPKAGQSTLVPITVSVVEGNRNKVVLDQLPKLRFKCLPFATTWIYRREE